MATNPNDKRGAIRVSGEFLRRRLGLKSDLILLHLRVDHRDDSALLTFAGDRMPGFVEAAFPVLVGPADVFEEVTDAVARK